MIKYIQGDLFQIIKPLAHQKLLVPHVCNIHKVAGAGFVVPLRKHFPKALEKYENYEKDWKLGDIQFYTHGNVTIANMMSQTLGEKRPLYYNALVKCMDEVADYCLLGNYQIIAPKFASDLAGGHWPFVEELIHDCWIRQNIGVTIVEFKV